MLSSNRRIIILLIFLTYSINANSQIWKPLSPLLYGDGGPSFIKSLDLYNNKLILCGGIIRIGNNLLPQPTFGTWSRPLTWDGNVYDTIPELSRFYGLINSFAEYNGKLYCGGDFQNMGNIGVGNISNTKFIARYNGINMEALTSVIPSYIVKTLTVKDNILYIAGDFINIGSNTYGCIASYDGTSYSHLGFGVQGTNPHIEAMTEYNNEIIISGSFEWVNNIYIPSGIAAWNGTIWHKITDEFLVSPRDMVVDTINNFLYVASQEISTDTSSGIKRWDGQSWDDLLLPSASVAYGTWTGTKSGPYTVSMYKKELYAALNPIDTINFLDSTLWYYDGIQWQNVPGTGKYALIEDMCVYNDDLYIGGYFKKVGNDSVNGIVALHKNEPNGCNWLIPRVFTNCDTFYLGTGQSDVQFYNNNAYAQSWQWDFGDSGTDNIKDPLHTYTQPGTYSVTITVTEDGCAKIAQKTITVLNGNDLKEYTKEKLNFKLYPNPTTDNITIELTSPNVNQSEIRIYSNSGSLQKSYPLLKESNKIIISTSLWTNNESLIGLFVDGKQVFVEKVIKK